MNAYRTFLAVIHLVKPATALMTPAMISKIIGKWAWTKLRGRKTLIERNYPVPAPEPAGLPFARRA
jgi:hypothetical protein